MNEGNIGLDSSQDIIKAPWCQNL